jgi:pimeloyl-ACP methyl ester carboxylesterase
MKRIVFLLVVLVTQMQVVTAQNNIFALVNNRTLSGTFTVYSKTAGLNPNLLTRPILICEGFDPSGTIDAQQAYNMVNGNPCVLANNVENRHLLSELRQRGYDVVVLDLNNNSVAIQDNAELFKAFIREMNRRVLENGSISRLTVIGISMGGLIARYALSDMERMNEDHRVERYISFDSPHRGANVPLGLQHLSGVLTAPISGLTMFCDVARNLGLTNNFGLCPSLRSIWGIELPKIYNPFDGSAPLQMSAVNQLPNLSRLTFINNLQGVGSYPKESRNIGVALSVPGMGQPFGQGKPIINWEPGVCILDIGTRIFGRYIGWRWCPFYLNARANAMNGDWSGTTAYLDGGIMPFINTYAAKVQRANYFWQRDYFTAPADTRIDHVPGSYFEYEFLRDFANTVNTANTSIPIKQQIKICIKIFRWRRCVSGGIDFSIHIPWHKVIGRFSSQTDYKAAFVPTLSALAINNNNWFQNVREINNYPYPRDKSVTFFDAITHNEGNHSRHPYLRSGSVATFLMNEISPRTIYIQNREFKSGFSHSFEAQNIIIGNNVDIVPNRSEQGEVIFGNGSQINLIVPDGGSIQFVSGVTLSPGSNINIIRDSPIQYPDITFTSNCLNNNVMRVASQQEDNTTANEAAIPTVEPTIKPLKITQNAANGRRRSTMQNSAIAYPVPTSDILHLKIFSNQANQLIVSLIDMQGKEISTLHNSQVEAGNTDLSFDITSIPTGIYACKINIGNELIIKKVVVN